MKKYLISFSVLFVVLSLVLLVFYSNLGLVVERAIENYGSKIMGTEVAVDKVTMQPRAGKASITGLTIANPSGYRAANAFVLSEITATIDFQAEIVREIVIKQPVINIEVIGGTSNIEYIADRIKAYQADSGSQSAGLAAKKLKGATFSVPSSPRVETHPMGLGTTREVRSWYRSTPSIAAVEMTVCRMPSDGSWVNPSPRRDCQHLSGEDSASLNPVCGPQSGDG